MEAYYLHNGQEQFGPFTLSEIQARGLKSDEFAWCEGMDTWKPVLEVEELVAFFPDQFLPSNLSIDEQENNVLSEEAGTNGLHNDENKSSNKTKLWKDIKEFIGFIIVGIIIGSYEFDFPFPFASIYNFFQPIYESINEFIPKIIRGNSLDNSLSAINILILLIDSIICVGLLCFIIAIIFGLTIRLSEFIFNKKSNNEN